MSRPVRLLLNVARPTGEVDPVAVAQDAVRAGADGVGLADSPRLMPDCWVESERVLAGTGAALAGPVVASLGLRHPSTVAGALASLEQHHPGRVFAVLGRGESSVANEGLAVPSLRQHVEALADVRERLGPDLLAGRLLGAASGPRTITATAAAVGGVLVDVGTDPSTAARAVALARRDDPSTSVWLFLRALVVDDPADAAAAAAPLLGSAAARLAGAPEWFGLGDDELTLARAVAGRHDYRHHGTSAATGADPSSDDDAARLVRSRFLLVADAGEVTRRVAALAALGIDGLVVAGGLPAVVPSVRRLVPALRAGLAGHPPPQEPS